MPELVYSKAQTDSLMAEIGTRIQDLFEGVYNVPRDVQSVVSYTDAAISVLDAQASTFNSVAVGGTQGLHQWSISGQRNVVSLAGTATPLTLVPLGNAAASGDDAFRNATGSGWDSAAYSAESFDPAAADFMLLATIEATEGTIREMVGASSDPTANSSYTSQDFAIYQVNNYIGDRVYENGANVSTAAPRIYPAIGDQLGVRVRSGVLDYVHVSGGVVTSFYTSLHEPTLPLYFRASLNRGTDQSGSSDIQDAVSIQGGSVLSETVTISGGSSEPIRAADIQALAEIGVEVQAGATYSRIEYIRQTSPRYDNGTGPFDLSVTHGFGGLFAQSALTA